MGRVNKDFARCALWLALFSGCEVDPHEPDPLFAGAWIDIHGRDRAPEDTCGGTFAYVDAYAGALAEEFGVTEHMGSYRWYSPAQYTAERPCGDAYACTYDRTLNSTLLPHEHELVHLANFAAGACPSALAEGLAEYYSPWGNDANSNDFDLLVARLERPSEDPPDIEYGILGRFAGYLVDRFGITNVLEVCRVTGRYPDGAQLLAAMQSQFGVDTEQLLADFESTLGSCDLARVYQSHVFACGVAEAAPDVGVVGEIDLEFTLTLDCADYGTIGPLGDTIWTTRRVEFDADATYLISVTGQDVEITDVELRLSKCGPCGIVKTFTGEVVAPEQFETGRYSLDLFAPDHLRGSVSVNIQKL
jgi:hypothetical protein